MYLLVDCMSDYKEIGDLKTIKDLLIVDLVEDIFNNVDERDVVEGNVKVLKKLAMNTMTLSEMKEELNCYSYKIIDLLQIQRDLEDLKNYFAPNKEPITISFDTVINTINKGVNENGRKD